MVIVFVMGHDIQCLKIAHTFFDSVKASLDGKHFELGIRSSFLYAYAGYQHGQSAQGWIDGEGEI